MLYERLTELVEIDVLDALNHVDREKIILPDDESKPAFIVLEKPSSANARETLYYRCKDIEGLNSFKEELNKLNN